MSETEQEAIAVEFSGKAANKIKDLQDKFGQSPGAVVSGAVSVLSSMYDFADKDGTITVFSKGQYHKVKLPTQD